MPIRVEHGPNLAAVGQLAYRTGQLEYRNKRRTELERLAQQQAEMRQRAQQQQQQIAATLQGQKMSYMGAMQRLQQAQQFGQINAEQANQWKVQADVKAQENRVLWGKQMGQNQLDLANMNAGIADQRTVQNIQNAHRREQAFQHLNPAGEGEWLNLGKQKVAAGLNKEIPPQELPGVIAALDAKQDALVDQDEYTYGKDTKVGFRSVHIRHTDLQIGNEDEEARNQAAAIFNQPKVYKTVKVRNPDGSVVYEYTPATTQMIELPDGTMKEVPLPAQQIEDNTTTIVRRAGRDYLGKLNSTNGIYEVDDNAKPIDTPEWLAQEAEIKRAEAERLAREKWYTEREKDRQDALAAEKPGIENPLAHDPVKWHKHYAFPEYVAPTAPVPAPLNEGDPNAPGLSTGYGMGPEQDQVIPLDAAAQAVPLEQPVAPVAPPAIGGPAQPQVAPQGPMAGQPQPVAQAPVSKEFEAVPAEYHPRKQWGDTPVKSTPEGYKMMGRLSIYAIAPEDQQAVYQERQREAKILPWDSEERGGVSPGTIANALKNGPLEYGAKVDLSKDNSPFAAAWKEATGQDVLVINDDLMWKLLSPGLTEEQQAELQQLIYTQKKEHFEYYGEPSDFPSDNVMRFRERVETIRTPRIQ